MSIRRLAALSVLAACTARSGEPIAEVEELRGRVAELESRLTRAQADIEALKGEIGDARQVLALLKDVGKMADEVKLPPALGPAVDPLLDEPSEPPSSEYTVERALMAEGLERQGRFIPNQKDGKIVGAKIFGVRPGSALKAMGLHNGDVLLRIDGTPLDTAESFLSLLKVLPERDRFTLDLERRGQPLSFTITVK